MSKELEKYAINQKAVNVGLKDAGLESIIDYHEMTVGEFLKLAAMSNIDLSAQCIRPVEVKAD